MIFDTHAHYDDEQFDTDRDELLSSMAAGGIGTIVDAAATVESWDKIVELAEKYSFIYGSVGVHPDEVGALNEENFARMRELLKKEKIVAVGEIGLDYYWDNSPREVQKKWFERQLALAREVDLPVIIHIDSQIKRIAHTRLIRYTLSGNIIRHTMHSRGIYNR